jgi:hypothetical protein
MKYNKPNFSLPLLTILCATAMGANATERPQGLTDADVEYVKELISSEVKSNQEATDARLAHFNP